MEEKLEITDENYDRYHSLYDIKNKEFYGTKKQIIIHYLITIVLEVICVSGAGIFYASSSMLGFCIGMIAACSIHLVSKPILSKISFRNFKEEYPNIDINIDKEELKKALVKYQELSKVEKDFEEKKEEHLENYPEAFRSMTPSEKIAFLEKEKEFWEQEKILEKYASTELDIHKELGEKKI